jgi:hypothetical protein
LSIAFAEQPSKSLVTTKENPAPAASITLAHHHQQTNQRTSLALPRRIFSFASLPSAPTATTTASASEPNLLLSGIQCLGRD